jgi:hypothetical protein
MEEDYCARICGERLKEILPAADILICSYSSTLRWAVALSIPAINVDLWDLRWETFRGLEDYYVTVRDVEQLEAALTSLRLGDKKKSALNSGVLCDGKAMERLAGLLTSRAAADGGSLLNPEITAVPGR